MPLTPSWSYLGLLPKLGVYLGGGPGCRSEGAGATGVQSYQHLVRSSQNTFQSSLSQRWGQKYWSIDCLPPLVKCKFQMVGVGGAQGPPCQSKDQQPVLEVRCGQHEGLEACMEGPLGMVQSEEKRAPVSWASGCVCLPFSLIFSLIFSRLWPGPHPPHKSADPLLHNNVLAKKELFDLRMVRNTVVSKFGLDSLLQEFLEP